MVETLSGKEIFTHFLPAMIILAAFVTVSLVLLAIRKYLIKRNDDPHRMFYFNISILVVMFPLIAFTIISMAKALLDPRFITTLTKFFT